MLNRAIYLRGRESGRLEKLHPELCKPTILTKNAFVKKHFWEILLKAHKPNVHDPILVFLLCRMNERKCLLSVLQPFLFCCFPLSALFASSATQLVRLSSHTRDFQLSCSSMASKVAHWRARFGPFSVPFVLMWYFWVLFWSQELRGVGQLLLGGLGGTVINVWRHNVVDLAEAPRLLLPRRNWQERPQPLEASTGEPHLSWHNIRENGITQT